MPAPANYNNIAYARQYKADNVVEDKSIANNGVEVAIKGSVDMGITDYYKDNIPSPCVLISSASYQPFIAGTK